MKKIIKIILLIVIILFLIWETLIIFFPTKIKVSDLETGNPIKNADVYMHYTCWSWIQVVHPSSYYLEAFQGITGKDGYFYAPSKLSFSLLPKRSCLKFISITATGYELNKNNQPILSSLETNTEIKLHPLLGDIDQIYNNLQYTETHQGYPGDEQCQFILNLLLGNFIHDAKYNQTLELFKLYCYQFKTDQECCESSCSEGTSQYDPPHVLNRVKSCLEQKCQNLDNSVIITCDYAKYRAK